MMDKKSLIAIALITVVILLLPSYYDLVYDQADQVPLSSRPKNDAYSEQSPSATDMEQILPEAEKKAEKPAAKQELPVPDKTIPEQGPEIYNETIQQVFTEIETPLVSARLSNQGGGNFEFWHMAHYSTWKGEPAQIIDQTIKNGIFINFLTSEGENINLNKYRFEIVGDLPEKIELKENESYTIRYQVKIKESVVRKSLTFYGNSYHVELVLDMSDAKTLLLNDDYEIGWQNGLPSNEINGSRIIPTVSPMRRWVENLKVLK